MIKTGNGACVSIIGIYSTYPLRTRTFEYSRRDVDLAVPLKDTFKITSLADPRQPTNAVSSSLRSKLTGSLDVTLNLKIPLELINTAHPSDTKNHNIK